LEELEDSEGGISSIPDRCSTSSMSFCFSSIVVPGVPSSTADVSSFLGAGKIGFALSAFRPRTSDENRDVCCSSRT
jgi:hypothetical protein